ncbi:hypothetical protein R6Q59_003239 [Mikania micrantha]
MMKVVVAVLVVDPVTLLFNRPTTVTLLFVAMTRKRLRSHCHDSDSSKVVRLRLKVTSSGCIADQPSLFLLSALVIVCWALPGNNDEDIAKGYPLDH